LREFAAALEWLAALPHPEKVFVAGNHDFLFKQNGPLARSLVKNATYLEGTAAEAAGLRIWGGPWQPWFCDWAFNLQRGEPLAEKWKSIPEGVDILVTHGPPSGILDRTATGEAVGCEALRDRITGMERPPRLHVFGHIHEAYGIHTTPATIFANASICDLRYAAVNPAIVIDLPAA
jgi:predicted phosphohydrolase